MSWIIMTVGLLAVLGLSCLAFQKYRVVFWLILVFGLSFWLGITYTVFSIQIVPNYAVADVFQFGKKVGQLEAGLHHILPWQEVKITRWAKLASYDYQAMLYFKSRLSTLTSRRVDRDEAYTIEVRRRLNRSFAEAMVGFALGDINSPSPLVKKEILRRVNHKLVGIMVVEDWVVIITIKGANEYI